MEEKEDEETSSLLEHEALLIIKQYLSDSPEIFMVIRDFDLSFSLFFSLLLDLSFTSLSHTHILS